MTIHTSYTMRKHALIHLQSVVTLTQTFITVLTIPFVILLQRALRTPTYIVIYATA